MSNWESELKAFEARVERRIRDIHAKTAFELRDSVKEGSTVTGAPGQPVVTSFLKNSWQLTHPAPLVSRLTTNTSYAPAIEENTPSAYDPAGEDRPDLDVVLAGGPVAVSEVGGPHSVKLTVAGFPKIVRNVVREVVRD